MEGKRVSLPNGGSAAGSRRRRSVSFTPSTSSKAALDGSSSNSSSGSGSDNVQAARVEARKLLRKVRSEGPEAVKRHATSAVRGGGVPLSVWLLGFFCLSVYALRSYELSPETLVVLGWVALVVWIAPLKQLATILDRCGALREHVFTIVRHLPDLFPYLLDLLPYLPKLIDNISAVGPYLDDMMAEKEHVLPILPEVLAQLDKIVPVIDVLGPKLHVIAPYTSRLLPHVDVLLPHVAELEPYLDDMIVLLDVRGWEEALPYLDDLAPYIKYIAPHASRLAPHIDPLLPHLPILVKYIHTLAPNMDETVDVLDRLMPLLSLLPLVDQTGLMYSKVLMRSLPTLARVLPKGAEPARRALASPMPSPFQSQLLSAERMSISVPEAVTHASGVTYYVVVVNDRSEHELRYSQLRRLHDEIVSEISTYCRMKLVPFPPKTTLGRALSANGTERRRLALDNFFQCVADHSDLVTEESPAFRKFVRLFYQQQAPPGAVMLSDLEGDDDW